MTDILINIGSGIFGGLIVWLFQQIYQNRKEKKSNALIKSNHLDKIIDKNILNTLKPEANIGIMHNLLGVPLRVFKKDDFVFSEKSIRTNSFLYSFKNTNIKITSEDNQSIDSITLISNDKIFDISNLISEFGLNSGVLNKARVNQELINNSRSTFIEAREDYSFAFTYSIAKPFYLDVTLFGPCEKNFHEYFETQDPNNFLNGIINGVCIAKYMSEKSFYIYQYELR